MNTVLTIVLVLAGFSLITLILLQQGKGADAGAAFGSGASSTIFGSRGSASFLSRSTAVLATIFFLASLGLAYFAEKNVKQQSIVEKIQSQQQKPEQKIQEPQEPATPPDEKKEPAGTSGAKETDVPTLPEKGAETKPPAKK